MKLLSLKIWLSVLALGLVLVVATPSFYQSREASHDKREGGRVEMAPQVSWMALLSQFLVGAGSVGAAVRGSIELVKLFLPKKRRLST